VVVKDMEIKDVILSTLKEIEDGIDNDVEEYNDDTHTEVKDTTTQRNTPVQQAQPTQVATTSEDKVPSHSISTEDFLSETLRASKTEPTMSDALAKAQSGINKDILEEERVFLNSIRERVLVLFEGLQSPNNRNIEAKVDLIINFLEYQLAVVDERLEKIQKDILSL
jgi:hypothetical protein